MRPIPGIGVTLDPGSGTKSTGGVIGAADATIRADDRPFMIVGATASCAAFAVTDDAAGSRLKRQVSEWTCRSYLHRLFEATGQTGHYAQFPVMNSCGADRDIARALGGCAMPAAFT